MGLVTGVLSLAREPVRLTLRAWELGLSSAASAARLGLELLDPERSRPMAEPYPPPPPRSRGNGGAPDVVDVAPGVRAEAASAAADSPPAVPDELIPDHVDEEVVLVAEVAEEGAEDGAGPELHIDEPWEGYDRMAAVELRPADRRDRGARGRRGALRVHSQEPPLRARGRRAGPQALGARTKLAELGISMIARHLFRS